MIRNDFVRRGRFWFVPALMLLVLTGCADGLYSSTVVFSGEHRWEADMMLSGDLIIRAGDVVVDETALIQGNVIILGGELQLAGTVTGDLSVLGGSVQLEPSARINGDLRRSGGELCGVETAVIQGDRLDRGALPLPDAPVRRGELFLRQLSAALLLAAAAATWAHRGRPTWTRINRTIQDHLPVTIAAGMLLLLVLPALLVMMAFTVVLLPLVILFSGGVFLLGGYGIAAVGYLVGEEIGRRIGWDLSPRWLAFGGVMVLFFLVQIPYLGDLLALVIAVALAGSLMLTRLGRRPFRPTDDNSPASIIYSRPGAEGG
jgi:cytoskeletal protein CcmA (bactofilin family)